jgi:hypothetical protein
MSDNLPRHSLIALAVADLLEGICRDKSDLALAVVAAVGAFYGEGGTLEELERLVKAIGTPEDWKRTLDDPRIEKEAHSLLDKVKSLASSSPEEGS